MRTRPCSSVSKFRLESGTRISAYHPSESRVTAPSQKVFQSTFTEGIVRASLRMDASMRAPVA